MLYIPYVLSYLYVKTPAYNTFLLPTQAEEKLVKSGEESDDRLIRKLISN